MRSAIPYILLFTLLAIETSCRNNHISTGSPKSGPSKKIEREIAVYKEGPSRGDTDYLFTEIRKEAFDLELEPIEDGFDSLQLRIWLGHSLAVKRNVVVLKNTNKQWTAQLITYSHGHSEKGKTFISNKDVKAVTPKSGWANFIQRLFDLQILVLPNGQDIQGYRSCGGTDGIDYVFESATRSKYRFYYYCNPDVNMNQFREVRNVVEFSNLLEKEFNFTYTK